MNGVIRSVGKEIFEAMFAEILPRGGVSIANQPLRHLSVKRQPVSSFCRLRYRFPIAVGTGFLFSTGAQLAASGIDVAPARCPDGGAYAGIKHNV